MAPVLPVVLPLQPRIRLAQGLWLLSWLLALVGGLTLFCSGHLLVQLRHLGTFLAPSCPFATLPQVALAASAVALGTGLVGSGASRASLDAAQYPPWRGVLGPLLVSGTAGGGGLLVLALGLALVLPGTLDTGLEEGLGTALAHYKDTEVPGRCQAKRLLDELQIKHQCCGRHGYKDWFGIQWVSSRYLDPNDQDVVDRIQSNVEGLYLIDGVPFSCCNPHSPRPCLQSQLSDPHAHPLYDPRQPNLNLWAQGCHGVLLGYLQGLASTLGNLLAVTFLLQALVLLGLRYLQTALEGLGGVMDGEGEAQGYLFPGGLKDMLKTVWLQGGVAHRPAPEEAPLEEAPPKEGPSEV
ncbi:Rod outer segment membrane protein 1 [Camelus dromedarius]|nr:rod outer segment membrane protein 1 [Camelus bactrianus]XP_010954726.1 rod outer segment membrane protein 1 [Camelus bactrianus]XP_010954727.1 rod outer segment membrane protein 1 [Camelus bactrianus]XP_010981300.2 rod outer segment membrane protein 1 [Camelus dromedarius]XP_010981301.2 rod outer segment membrane protein 1 [Camelus dromedarius]XP_031315313.1 rod outer segment membrane protein 1 [Camelus dromedarius]XP_031315314.1 rod outer segment membrane protein 1 [Camelus dromedarius]